MSWSASDEDICAHENGPLRARPLGSLAASSIGIASILILAGSVLFLRPAELLIDELPTATIPQRPALPAKAEAPAPVAPKAAFDLDVPELAKEKTLSFEPPLQAGGRQEQMTFGAFDAGRFYLRLDILQPTGAKLGNSDFFLGMARHAAQAGLSVARIAQPTPLSTRAGAFEAADIRLSQRNGDGGAAGATERTCLAVRLIDPKLSLEIAGLGCGAAGRPLDRRVMSCLLDHVTYLPGGADDGLRRAFPKAEGQSCFAAPVAEAQGGARPAAKKRAARH
jgi:hypothetical protein